MNRRIDGKIGVHGARIVSTIMAMTVLSCRRQCTGDDQNRLTVRTGAILMIGGGARGEWLPLVVQSTLCSFDPSHFAELQMPWSVEGVCRAHASQILSKGRQSLHSLCPL